MFRSLFLGSISVPVLLSPLPTVGVPPHVGAPVDSLSSSGGVGGPTGDSVGGVLPLSSPGFVVGAAVSALGYVGKVVWGAFDPPFHDDGVGEGALDPPHPSVGESGGPDHPSRMFCVNAVGSSVSLTGLPDGEKVGFLVGLREGFLLGLREGDSVGDSVGSQTSWMSQPPMVPNLLLQHSSRES